MKFPITFILLTIWSSFGFAQNNTVSNSDFKEMIADWTGNLSYLNYQDDKSIFTIPCILKTTFKNGKLKTKITYDELDKKGKKMTSKSSFHISKDGQHLMVGKDKWKIISSKKSDTQIQIITQTTGDDNNRPSEFRMTLTITKGESIQWKKEVKYQGTENFFNRNNFSFVLNN